MKRLSSLLLFALILTLSGCAKKGRPSGGPKDETAPVFVTADPPYESINFDKREINLYFDEYIILKDLSKQLVISPPLNPENPSLITPQGTPSKYINIKLLDTLLPNTTYTFDFGNSVQDNNEGNKLERFKYVFSTGTYIDSLNLRGTVKNSYSSESIKDIKLLLHRLDTSYTDSTVYKVKPSYVASTLDSSLYNFSNLKEGKYFLMALEDKDNDYLFDPKTDQIGFYKDTIVLPRDSVIANSISLFTEILPYQFKRGKEERKGKLIFGFEGKANNLKLELISEVPEDFKTVAYFEKDKDTLNLWHSPIERDSLIFKVTNGGTIDTSVVKLRKKKLDSLILSSKTRSILDLNDTLFFDANNPIIKIDTSKVLFVDKDTVKVPYQSFISQKEPKVGFVFDKKIKEDYSIQLFPDALIDVFNQTNDTVSLKFKTRPLEDYGDITFTIQNPSSKSIIIELTDPKDKLERRQFINASAVINFKYLKPKTYKVRIIYDDNDNKKWDTGSFLNKQQPELIEYFQTEIELRANFSYNESITIKQ